MLAIIQARVNSKRFQKVLNKINGPYGFRAGYKSS